LTTTVLPTASSTYKERPPDGGWWRDVTSRALVRIQIPLHPIDVNLIDAGRAPDEEIKRTIILRVRLDRYYQGALR
jgi:hypothetical protein